MYTLIKLPKTNGINNSIFLKKKRKKLNACRERKDSELPSYQKQCEKSSMMTSLKS